MLPTQTAADTPVATNAGEPALPLELLELELSLDGFSGDVETFADAVRSAATQLGGDFLFDLPASGLAEDCLRIAALRMPRGEDGALEVVFALLDGEATAIRVENPDEKTEDLKRFADAFVDVLQRILRACRRPCIDLSAKHHRLPEPACPDRPSASLLSARLPF